MDTTLRLVFPDGWPFQSPPFGFCSDSTRTPSARGRSGSDLDATGGQYSLLDVQAPLGRQCRAKAHRSIIRDNRTQSMRET